jgi:hypothetical protein
MRHPSKYSASEMDDESYSDSESSSYQPMSEHGDTESTEMGAMASHSSIVDIALRSHIIYAPAEVDVWVETQPLLLEIVEEWDGESDQDQATSLLARLQPRELPCSQEDLNVSHCLNQTRIFEKHRDKENDSLDLNHKLKSSSLILLDGATDSSCAPCSHGFDNDENNSRFSSTHMKEDQSVPSSVHDEVPRNRRKWFTAELKDSKVSLPKGEPDGLATLSPVPSLPETKPKSKPRSFIKTG